MQFRRPLPIELLAVTLAALLMVGLGVWQLQRLQWKQGLLEHIAQAQNGPILGTLPQSEDELKALEYRHVMLAGHWRLDKPELHLVGQQSNGYIWLKPFQLEDSDQIVLVPLGWFPIGAQVSADLPKTTQVEGYIRLPKTKRLFSPDNHPDKNVWFIENVPEMEKALGLKLLPVVVETKPMPPLRNDHLGYAITWFMLAGACVVMYLIALRKKV